jgi:hypothetical protein
MHEGKPQSTVNVIIIVIIIEPVLDWRPSLAAGPSPFQLSTNSILVLKLIVQ